MPDVPWYVVIYDAAKAISHLCTEWYASRGLLYIVVIGLTVYRTPCLEVDTVPSRWRVEHHSMDSMLLHCRATTVVTTSASRQCNDSRCYSQIQTDRYNYLSPYEAQILGHRLSRQYITINIYIYRLFTTRGYCSFIGMHFCAWGLPAESGMDMY